MNNTPTAQFTMKINVDADNSAIYVDSKDRGEGFTLSFTSFREQVAALRELCKIVQVIVPKDSDLEAANLSTELKQRRGKLDEHEKLARWVARKRAGLAWDPTKREEFTSEADRKRFRDELAKTHLMSTSALKAAKHDLQTQLKAQQAEAEAA